ncbi:lactonohydrolase, partial [Metarhizium majus ARSEF 297]
MPAFYSTSAPADPSFAALGNATFVVWDKKRGLDLLGSDARFDVVFPTNFSHVRVCFSPTLRISHVPDTNELWFSSVAPGYTAINIVNLNLSPPRPSQVTLDPPILNPVGARVPEAECSVTVHVTQGCPPTKNQIGQRT